MAKQVKKLKDAHKGDLWLDTAGDLWFWEIDPDTQAGNWTCISANWDGSGFEILTSEKPNGKYGWGPFTRVKRPT